MIAIDFNILVYAEGLNDPGRQAAARALLMRLGDDEVAIPAQVLVELYNVLRRRSKYSFAQAAARIDDWAEYGVVVSTTHRVIQEAMEIAARHRLQWWDAIVLASASAVGCSELLSEDMQHGFTWRGVTVRNPFAA